jgi:hypothetical protein
MIPSASPAKLGDMDEKPFLPTSPSGRAVLGGIAGCLIVPIAGVFVLSFLRNGEPLEPGQGALFLTVTVGVGALLGAVFGAAVGARQIRGKAGSATRGGLCGAAVGIVVGWCVGGMVGLFAVVPGMFFGGLAGALAGCYLGATLHSKDKGRPTTAERGGVEDRELDG